ncbi:MAG: hypothetical protein IT216_04195 [Saprospiraceae bacterium]|nr:MAG: hypothetical protein UZ08_BCD001001423 [Candidatus Parvibacillus calidus]MCC7148405.1 hypothetical protein [Saprospiraceae bacterium]WKZ62014.1 MAG: DUF6340 family protein [Saprospiraceae bacterium]
MQFFPVKRMLIAVAVLSTVIMSGCKIATYTHVDQVIAPRFSIPADMRSVNLLDRSVSPYTASKTTLPTPTDKARTTMLNSVLSGLPVSSKRILQPLKEGRENGPATEIKKTGIREVASGAGGLLSLEQYEFSETRTYKDITKETRDPSGRKVTIPAVQGTRQVYLRTYWRLYDVRSGSVIYKIPQFSENIYETEGLTRAAVNAQMDTTNIVTVATLSQKLSSELIRDINPEHIKSYWTYYIKGHDIISRSGRMIEMEDFAGAVSFLSQNIRVIESEKLRLRASYNLIVAYYFNGQKDKALQLAGHEYNKTGKYEFKSLYDKIYSR